MLEEGPTVDGHQNFVPEDSFVDASEDDSAQRLVVELSEGFWSQPPGEQYAAAAQITFTLAGLEEGKELLLLNGTTPGELLDGSFASVEQPVGRSTFDDVRPWVQITQPVAGAVVGSNIPVSVQLREGIARAEIRDGERTLATDAIRADSTARLKVAGSHQGEIELVITIRGGVGDFHVVRMPLTLSR